MTEPRLERYEQYSEEVADKLQRYPRLLIEGPFTKYLLQFRRRSSGSAAARITSTWTLGIEFDGAFLEWTCQIEACRLAR